MGMLKRAVSRIRNKPGYSIVLNLIAWPLFAHNVSSAVSTYYNPYSAGDLKPSSAMADTIKEMPPDSIDDVAEQSASAQQPEEKNIQLAEPFPEYNSNLTNVSWQNMTDRVLENDVVDNINNLLIETYKNEEGKEIKRWRKADDPVKLRLEKAVSNLTQYMDFFNIFAEIYNAPRNLLLSLAAVESYGIRGAESDAGAAGLHQLMKDAARDCGVGVDDNGYFDMRFDPKESVRGGTEYISRLIKKYDGNAMFALAAYNAGPGRIDKILDSISKEHGMQRSGIGWDILKGYLPDETKEYVIKVLSRKIILDMLYEELDINWQPLFSESVLSYKIGEGETFYGVAMMFGVPATELALYNRHLGHPDPKKGELDKVKEGSIVYVPINNGQKDAPKEEKFLAER